MNTQLPVQHVTFEEILEVLEGARFQKFYEGTLEYYVSGNLQYDLQITHEEAKAHTLKALIKLFV